MIEAIIFKEKNSESCISTQEAYDDTYGEIKCIAPMQIEEETWDEITRKLDLHQIQKSIGAILDPENY